MASNPGQKRNNPFSRTASPSPGPNASNGRPKSMIMPSPTSATTHSPSAHTRNQSYSSLATPIASHNASLSAPHSRLRGGSSSSGTFAPSFIKAESTQRGAEAVRSIEGENDFSGKRYVWLNDPDMAFVKGWVVEELQGNQILVQCDDGSVCFLDPVAIWLR